MKYKTLEEKIAAQREAKRRYVERHPEKRKESKEKYRKKNMQKWRDYAKKAREKHPEKIAKRQSAWARKNKGKINFKKSKRNAIKRKALPKWAKEFFVKEIYDLAVLRTKITGIKWHVDHIVPLQSELVCGLHCEQNLRVIPAYLNASKKNYYWPEMPE